jgi:hypothetical protein
MKNTIRDRRQWLKHSVYGSNSILNKTDEMGINYSLKTYDVNIVEKYGQLLDFNFENFTYRNDLALVDGVLTSIEEIANTILNSLNVDKEELPILYKKCAEALSDVVAKCDRIFSGKRFSYSTYKLFFYSPLLVDDDKNFILERYRLVSSILKIETLFKNKNLELRNGNLTISIKNFFRKYKAIIIDLLGCDLKNPTTEYSKRLKASIDCKIKDKHFYDVNISLRNNCHYSQINGFTESDIKLLDKYQNIYLKTILKSFKENLYINIDDRDIYQTY